MTSIIRMSPLSGGMEESPHCYLLEVDQFTFLLDCGWDSNFDMNFIKELKKHIPKIDAVLLSYPDNLHLGALPYAVGKLGLSCPIYATVPVYKMGQMFMYDTYQARHNIEDFSLFTLDEVDNTFEKITQLKYNQTVALKGKGEGLSIVPLPAGHMIGGTLWKIAKDGEEDILYAVDMNHKKERHLNGCDIEKVQRPSLLIMDAFNAKYTQRPRRKRDEKLMTNILQTLRNSGNVLVCVDTAGRVLELAHMVDQLWQNKDSGLLAYSLALLNNVSYNVVEFAKSQIEWMSEKLMRTFEGKRNNPFQFKHLKLCHSMNEVNKVPSPKVVLASMPDLESGFSRELFIQWAPNPKNSIILTSRSADGTLGQDLIMKGGNRTIPIEIKKRVKLTGSELEEYRRKEEGKEKNKAKGVEGLLDDEDSSDDEMEVSTIVTGSKPSVIKHDIIMKPESNKTQSGFFKSTKTKYPMFPFYEEKIRWDDYGEIIRPEEWMDKGTDNADENMDTSNHPDREEEPDYEEIPTKCVSSTQNLAVKASVQFIDFEGRSDGENIAKLVTHLKPRRVIVVRGNEESCKGLAEVCKEIVNRVRGGNAEQKQYVFTPINGEVVDATTESFIYQVRLPDPLMGLLSFSKGKDGYLAWVDGMIKISQQELMDIQPQADSEQEVDKNQLIPSLEPMPAEEVEGHPAIFVNELKLSDFKLELTKNNISSEFQGGVLFCGDNNTVALRRHDSGRVTIEGCLCDEYYQVRDLLYEQYAIL